MTKILLIRHGESEANRKNIFAGHIDPDLQDTGVLQAKLTAQYIKENYRVDKIYSSDLKRAYNTAKQLAELIDLEIITDKGLREIAAGEWEGVVFDDLIKIYPDDFKKWMDDIGNAGCTGGETVKELTERVFSTVEKIARENDGHTVAIASHATPIRTIITMIKYGIIDRMNDVEWVSNASVTELEYDNGNFRIVLIGEDAHLKSLVTRLPDNI